MIKFSPNNVLAIHLNICLMSRRATAKLTHKDLPLFTYIMSIAARGPTGTRLRAPPGFARPNSPTLSHMLTFTMYTCIVSQSHQLVRKRMAQRTLDYKCNRVRLDLLRDRLETLHRWHCLGVKEYLQVYKVCTLQVRHYHKFVCSVFQVNEYWLKHGNLRFLHNYCT